jgi:hypothetical protein
MYTKQLHDSISAVCPIDGIAIGDPEDKSTWRLDFQPDATEEQRAAAAAIMEGFDPAAAVARDAVIAEIQQLENKQHRAIREVLLGIGAETATARLEDLEAQIASLRAQL